MSKKDQITSLFQLGITGIEELAMLTKSTPSYVASVLRGSRLLSGYFDLYTSSERPMNVYSKYFTKKLGFKDARAARRSVDYLNTLYNQFARIEDRAGQHHTLIMALTMRNRALWSNKEEEARIYSEWLTQRLTTTLIASPTKRMDRILQKKSRYKKEPQTAHTSV